VKDRPARRLFEAHSDQDRSGAIFSCHLAIVATPLVFIISHRSQRLRAPAGPEKSRAKSSKLLSTNPVFLPKATKHRDLRVEEVVALHTEDTLAHTTKLRAAWPGGSAST